MPKQKLKKFFSEGWNLPKIEEKVLNFWKVNRIFDKSLAKNKKKSAAQTKTFVFYEGPPTANGRPGIHHVIARSFKDVILRYKTMRGYYVPRKGGWDTHGLPVELEVEKQLGLKSKKEIEAYGVAEFNRKCKESVWKYKDEWERLTERMGYWLDMKHPYITYETDYIETLWWVIKTIYDKGYMYEGHKVVPWCPRCGTALSSHELAQGYEEVTDQSVYVKFKLKPGQKWGKDYETKDRAYILAWTTTPWTLPGNVALAVGEKIKYSAVRVDGVKELLILATNTVEKVLKDRTIEVVHENISGSELVGLKYEPLFQVKALNAPAAHQVYTANFVTTEDGTGVVHTAVMYGEDDYQLGLKVGLPQHHTVDEQGKFTKEVEGLSGMFVKAKETEKKIFEHLEKNGNLLKIESYTHEYPHCWRCGTPLLYYARNSWFVGMNKLRKELITNNKAVNWTPAHIKEGRFGEWLREAKDWNFSRERYWGTPLPIWRCDLCEHKEALGSVSELGQKTGGLKNTYWVLRHGESATQLKRIHDNGEGGFHLTLKGRTQVERAAAAVKKLKLDLIVSSPVLRTKETAEIVAAAAGVKIETEPQFKEIQLGDVSGKPSATYHEAFPTYESKFKGAPAGGETLTELRKRTWAGIETLEKKYAGKKILIVSHEYPVWMLAQAVEGWDESKAIYEKEKRGSDFIAAGEIQKVNYRPGPRNETGELDLHRPYIDSVKYACTSCGKGKMGRIKELADVWFDSGAMPFAQMHFPFGQSEKSLTSKIPELVKKIPYPADYIVEAMDQTRGWFYTLLAVATLLGQGAPYKNVTSLGLIHDKYGRKMSKSKGNVVDPWLMMEKYGIDAVRWYFYAATPPGEPKNFDEEDVKKTFRKLHAILYNSFVFFKTYGKPRSNTAAPRPSHVLDRWILALLAKTGAEVTLHLDRYEVREAALALEALTDDLSRWFIRRSRRRFQRPTNQGDYRNASATLEYVLRETAKMIAPMNPFFAEALWEDLSKSESVHLETWPELKPKSADEKLLAGMEEVRKVASAALAKRAELGIKLKQPLASLTLKKAIPQLAKEKQLAEVLKEELNIKALHVDPRLKEELVFDTKITPELKAEGTLREIMRTVQDLRQEAGYEPKHKIVLMFELPNALRELVAKNEWLLKKELNANLVEFKRQAKFDAELETKIENEKVWFGVRKIKQSI